MWKGLNKGVDLGEPTSFLDHVYLGCTQRNVKYAKVLLTIAEPCLNHEFARSELKNYHARKIFVSLRGHCELANKTTQQLYKVSTPCLDDHHFKEEELKSVGELSTVCSQIVLRCFFLARIERPDILWSVKQLARSMTKWTKACNKNA